MVTTIKDEALLEHAERARGLVVVITGSAHGIGKATALLFANHGAKVVVADYDQAAAKDVADEVISSGGEAISCKCDVTNYEEQEAMFMDVVSQFGQVDIVVANAGVPEGAVFLQPQVVDGKVAQPSVRTTDVDLVGVIYTAYLAQHYLAIGHSLDSGKLKSLILMSSVAAFYAFINGPLYGASKLGIVGLVRSMQQGLATKGIRVSAVYPFFAQTGLLSDRLKALLAGISLAPVDRISGAVLAASLQSDLKTTGDGYLLLHDGPVQVFSATELVDRHLYDHLNGREIATQSTIITASRDQPEASARQLNGSVVLIIGGASENGKSTALKFAQHGAKIVMADSSLTPLEGIIAEISKMGGEAIALKTDPGVFDLLQDVYAAAIDKFGSLDIVVVTSSSDQPNFGSTETTPGKLAPPNMTTIYSGFYGTAYALHLALYYLNLNRGSESTRPKAIVVTAATSAWQTFPGTDASATALFAQLNLLRSSHQLLAKHGLQTGIISPSTSTGEEVSPAQFADAALLAAVDPDLTSTGAGYVFEGDQMKKTYQENIRTGVYHEITSRLCRVFSLPAPTIP